MDSPKDSPESPFLLTEEAARLIRHEPGTLENWRSHKKGPPFFRVGGTRGSLILYDKAALLAWVRSKEQQPGTVTAADEPLTPRKANGSSKAKK